MTAYDIQKIDRNYNVVKSNGSFAILFALELYLDFINIFINLLNLLGKSKD
jgi:FtsH-binding integral membrane protein